MTTALHFSKSWKLCCSVFLRRVCTELYWRVHVWFSELAILQQKKKRTLSAHKISFTATKATILFLPSISYYVLCITLFLFEQQSFLSSIKTLTMSTSTPTAATGAPTPAPSPPARNLLHPHPLLLRILLHQPLLLLTLLPLLRMVVHPLETLLWKSKLLSKKELQSSKHGRMETILWL